MSDAKRITVDAKDIKRQLRELLAAIMRATNRQHDRALRGQLRSVVVIATEGGLDANLSDPHSELGALMMAANSCSKARGWLL